MGDDNKVFMEGQATAFKNTYDMIIKNTEEIRAAETNEAKWAEVQKDMIEAQKLLSENWNEVKDFTAGRGTARYGIQLDLMTTIPGMFVVKALSNRAMEAKWFETMVRNQKTAWKMITDNAIKGS